MQIIIKIKFTPNYFIIKLKIIEINIAILILIIIAYNSKVRITRVTFLHLIEL